MSALDLFASAMGAFMFLAIIALPFFPNTGDSAERVADIKSELKKAEAQIAEEQKQKAEIAKQRDEVQKKLDDIEKKQEMLQKIQELDRDHSKKMASRPINHSYEMM